MNKLKSKATSVKNIIVAWALGLITYIVIRDKTDFLQLAVLLATIPLAYIPTNVYQKKIEKEQENYGKQ